MRILNFAIMLLTVLMLFSCGSMQKTVSVQEETNTTVKGSETINGVSIFQETKISDDSLEIVITTHTTVYDTSRYDSITGKSPVLSETESTSTKRKGTKTKEDKNTKEQVSATKEESTINNAKVINQRKESASETKQPLYYSLLLYGFAFALLICTLAYWVFSKYRAKRKLSNNKDSSMV